MGGRRDPVAGGRWVWVVGEAQSPLHGGRWVVEQLVE